MRSKAEQAGARGRTVDETAGVRERNDVGLHPIPVDKPMSELMQLREHHANLARPFEQLGELTDQSRWLPQVELFDVCRELISTLGSHFKLQDWALYPRLSRESRELLPLLERLERAG